MELITDALLLSAQAHGEHGAVIRVLTPSDGLHAGYVRGGRSRRLRPVLQPGNRVRVILRRRVDTQLAAATVELVRSRADLAALALPGTALTWLAAASSQVLPEGDACPDVHAALDQVLDALAVEESLTWLARVVRYELLLLTASGFGLDLAACAVTGTTTDLSWVSPKTGRAVSASAGAAYATRLLPLPSFVTSNRPAEGSEQLVDGFRLTGSFLARNLFTGRAQSLLAARDRLVALAERELPK